MDQQSEARTVRRRARGLQRIASILDAAEIVFAKVGYEEANTHHIAKEAGISPGSLYQFFSNKEEIVQALVARYIEELRRVYSHIFSYAPPSFCNATQAQRHDERSDPQSRSQASSPGARG